MVFEHPKNWWDDQSRKFPTEPDITIKYMELDISVGST